MEDDDVLSRMHSRSNHQRSDHSSYTPRGRDYPPHGDSYRQPASYDADSSTHHDWHGVEPSRGGRDQYYAQGDSYGRSSRDEYEAADWVPRSSSNRYASSGRDWNGDWDRSYSKTSYVPPADNGWSAPPSYDQPGHNGFDTWSREEPRESRSGQAHDRDSYGWHRDDHRDSGWETRPRAKDREQGQRSWTERDRRGGASSLSHEDRSWEPAASWQQKRRDGGAGGDSYTSGNNQRYQNGRGGSNHDGRSGGVSNYQQQKKGQKKKKARYGHKQQPSRDEEPAGGPVNKCVERFGGLELLLNVAFLQLDQTRYRYQA
jgi:hypothetical protein